MSTNSTASIPAAPDNWNVVEYSWREISPIENQSVLEYHSVINVLNVIHALVDLCDLDGENPITEEILSSIRRIVAGFHKEPNLQKEALNNCKQLEGNVVAFTENKSLQNEQHFESLETIIEANQILNQRVSEILERQKTKGKWVEAAPETIREELKSFFNVVERNSSGNYKIVYDVADQEPKDYVVCIDLQISNRDSFLIPPTLIDIIRDLAANARKYTDPGGSIVIQLQQNKSEITLNVRDNGRGIPSDEISKVSNYGYRASNVQKKKTMGGGFGLTKALYFTKEHKGSLRIQSSEGEGTRISLFIPHSNQKQSL